MNPINTIPIQSFIQQVKSADLTQQKEVRLTIKEAKALVYCLADVSAKLLEDYSKLMSELLASQSASDISVQMDGGTL
jgi:hypothetical protein